MASRAHRRPLLASAVTASALTLTLAAGCGVGGTSRPIDEGESAVAASVVGGGSVLQPRSAGSITTETPNGVLVPAFLDAAAGAESDGGEAAVDRAREFLTIAAREDWKPGNELMIVRIPGDIPPPVASGDIYTVTVRYQVIGVLTAEGPIAPFADQAERVHTFEIAAEDGRWRLDSAPSMLMIRDTTLESFYRLNPIYFWDSGGTRLVPDLRYMPLTLPAQQRPSQVVRWLLQGPSPWLRPAVTPFRRDTTLKDPVQSIGGAVTVNLSSNAVDDNDDARRKLSHQLRWSLRSYVTESLELQIEGQSKLKDSSDDYLAANMAASHRQPELYRIDKGKVVLESERPASALAILNAKANIDVSYAAISTNHTFGAFVTERTGTSALTMVLVEDDSKPASERAVRGLPRGARIGRPVFISGAGGHLLVPVGGRLYAVGPTGEARPIAPAITGLQSVSVAPDGRRVAFVARGQAYVAGLSVEASSIALGTQPRSILPGAMTAAAVAWVSEEQVYVAGATDERAALFQVFADGAVAKDSSPEGQRPLTDVVAFPDRPDSRAAADIVVQTEANVLTIFDDAPVATNLVEPFYASG